MRHRCVVPQPLPLPLPFPQIFDGRISSGGDLPSFSSADGELPCVPCAGRPFRRCSLVMEKKAAALTVSVCRCYEWSATRPCR